jgi:hypothetical protein
LLSAHYVIGGFAAAPTLSSRTPWDSTVVGTGGPGRPAVWDIADQVFAARQAYGIHLQHAGFGFWLGDGPARARFWQATRT